MRFLLPALLLLSQCGSTQIKVEDYRDPEAKGGDACVIQTALNALVKKGHGTLEFDGTRVYRITRPIKLPVKSRPKNIGMSQIILNGNGCIIIAKNDTVNIFDRQATSQREALRHMMNTRFIVKNFNFRGGRKAINLSATYGSAIRECEFKGQLEACIDVQFGLNTRISHCQFSAFKNDGIRLRHGEEWGGSTSNSQSNHSVVESCRFYCGKGSHAAISVIASSGVRIKDLITEGSPHIEYGVYFNSRFSTTVKTFYLENYHMEHAPRVAGIYVRLVGTATIKGLYYQKAFEDFPVIWGNCPRGTLLIQNIPYIVPGSIVKSDAGEWRFDYCKSGFSKDKKWLTKVRGSDEYVRKKPEGKNFKFRR